MSSLSVSEFKEKYLNKQTWTCHYCFDKFGRVHTLENHLKIVHNKSLKDFVLEGRNIENPKCLICNNDVPFSRRRLGTYGGFLLTCSERCNSDRISLDKYKLMTTPNKNISNYYKETGFLTYYELLASKMLKELGVNYNYQHIFYFNYETFRRSYIVDFFLPDYNVAIEIDVGYHDNIRKDDYLRDKELLKNGVKILRIRNEHLINYFDTILKYIDIRLKFPGLSVLDFDGIITNGCSPMIGDIVITGRSFEESNYVFDYLNWVGFVPPVYFNPIPVSVRGTDTHESQVISGSHKSNWICNISKYTNIINIFEDNITQFNIIKSRCSNDIRCNLLISKYSND